MSQLEKTVDRILRASNQLQAQELIEAIAADDLGLPLVAASEGDARLVTFMLSRHGAGLPVSRMLVALWAIDQCETTQDTSCALNLLSWIGAELIAKSDIPVPVRRRISDFLVFCATSYAPVRMSLLDVLISTGKKVLSCLTSRSAKSLVEGLRDLRDADDELTRQDVEEISSLLTGKALAGSFGADPASLERIVRPVTEALDTTDLSQNRHERLRRWAERILSRERAAQRASADNARVIELAVSGDNVSVGRFAQLLTAVNDMLESIASALFPSATLGPLRPFAAASGSFVLQAVVGGEVGAKSADHFESIVLGLGDVAKLSAILEKHESVAAKLRSFVNATADQDGDVCVAFVHTSSARSIEQHKISAEEYQKTREWLETASSAQPQRHTWSGILVAADIKHGTFICNVGSRYVSGKVREPNILDKIRIGRPYVFALEESTLARPTGTESRFELLEIEAPEEFSGEMSIHDGEGVLPRGSVPQAALDRVARVVDLLGEGEAVTPAAVGVQTARAVDYYFAAGRILGLLDRDNELTNFGRMWKSMSEREREKRLAYKFEESPIGQAWIRWSGVERMRDVDPSLAEEFLAECTDLSPKTRATRASHLRQWLAKLGPALRET